jgi:hypothetical protein
MIEVILMSEKSSFEAYEKFCLSLFSFDCSYLERVARNLEGNLISIVIKTASSKASS